jgi:hypothetical protein
MEGHVTHTEEPVLYAPVSSAQVQQPPGVGLLPTQAGYRADHLPARLAVDLPLTRDPAHLLETRPLEISG